MFADRLKTLRAEKGITQVQLAEILGVTKGTVAMWETGKRQPNFETLETLSDIFDKRTDYILGISDDRASPKMTDEEIEQLGIWETEEHFHNVISSYLMLDEYGKNSVESLIRSEIIRCKEQDSIFPESSFMLTVRLKKNTNSDSKGD